MELQDIKVGQRVQAANPSELFASDFDGKFGVVLKTDEDLNRVWVQFDNGETDYGVFDDITLVEDVVELTPAQQRGYKEGDKFIVLNNSTFKEGSIVTLHRDDTSVCPLFAGEGTDFRCAEDANGNSIPGAYLMLDEVKPYVDPTPTEQAVDVYRKLFLLSLAGSVGALQEVCYNASKQAGWWTDLKTGEAKDPVALGPEKIALMHSELSEALEGLRKNQMDDKLPHRPMAEVELADCIIRALDWAGAMGYDVGGAIVEKLEFNATRADHKIENRQKDDGKKF